MALEQEVQYEVTAHVVAARSVSVAQHAHMDHACWVLATSTRETALEHQPSVLGEQARFQVFHHLPMRCHENPFAQECDEALKGPADHLIIGLEVVAGKFADRGLE